MKYYYCLFVVIFLPSIDANCNHTTEWFNENSPSQSQGHDIERFSLIRAKYPWKFELSRWTGSFEVRAAPNQNLNSTQPQLIDKYTRIYEGLICHAVNGKQCVDYEVSREETISNRSNDLIISILLTSEDSILCGI